MRPDRSSTCEAPPESSISFSQRSDHDWPMRVIHDAMSRDHDVAITEAWQLAAAAKYSELYKSPCRKKLRED